jgi:hypothetical protein
MIGSFHSGKVNPIAAPMVNLRHDRLSHALILSSILG